ncbi:MAG: hypothetical protein EOP06_13805 [Proteobacteria bacterium]|nr:MAG: hypothetical protein EOP06_13805 [Pseudomonadota bacterium]
MVTFCKSLERIPDRRTRVQVSATASIKHSVVVGLNVSEVPLIIYNDVDVPRRTTVEGSETIDA